MHHGAAREQDEGLVDADGVGRLTREAEATVYFCVLEALQNVAKYAAASLTTVELRQAGGRLTFLVTDDGAGFDLAGPVTGSGLQGMRDRLAALGGSLTVSSAPGRGTAVAGALPCEPAIPSLATTR